MKRLIGASAVTLTLVCGCSDSSSPGFPLEGHFSLTAVLESEVASMADVELLQCVVTSMRTSRVVEEAIITVDQLGTPGSEVDLFIPVPVESTDELFSVTLGLLGPTVGDTLYRGTADSVRPAFSSVRSTPTEILLTYVGPHFLAVSPGDTTVIEGTYFQLNALVTDVSGYPLDWQVVWNSSDLTVAAVDVNGRVLGVAPGTAMISASSRGETAAAQITVQANPVVDVVEVSPTEGSVLVGQPLQLIATPRDQYGTALARLVTWTAEDDSIATVAGGGLVRGVSPGVTIIYATSDGVSGAAVITVLGQTVSFVQITPTSASISIGQTVQLDAVPLDDAYTPVPGRVVTWASDNELVASVTTGGLVTGLALGTAVMTATETIDGVSNTAVIAVGPDTQAPSAPTALTAVAVSSSQIDLTWASSSDNVAVVGYEISRDGAVVDSTDALSYSDLGLRAATTYYYAVRAFDVAGNSSAPSASTGVTTSLIQEQVVELVPDVNITMILIPPGPFDMGSPPDEFERSAAEGPVHQVTIQPGLWMSKYEVTQQQWEAVMGYNPVLDFPPYGVGPNIPVYYVSWLDVQNFFTQTTNVFRLPTESEWEYAARATTQTRYYWGDDLSYVEIDAYAVHSFNSGGVAADVGTKLANDWRLHDMSGNVYEWVEDDWHNDYLAAPPVDGTAWTDDPRAAERVMRGSSWDSHPRGCRSAYRYNYPISGRNRNIGFRVVWVP